MLCSNILSHQFRYSILPSRTATSSAVSVCSKDKKNQVNSTLYYVNGTSKSDCHPSIPDDTFQCLDFMDNNTGSEVLRVSFDKSKGMDLLITESPLVSLSVTCPLRADDVPKKH